MSLRVLAIVLMLLGAGACTHRSDGFYHRVRAGENLYRIGLRYDIDPRTLARVNRIRDVTDLQVGQRLFIPAVKSRRRPESRADSGRARQAARREALASAQLAFGWPLQGGTITSGFGRRHGRAHEGLDLAARSGTPIRAAESGKVIHSGRLGDYGRVVIIKHAGRFRSVYAHARKLYVRRGQFVERGEKIAEVGSSGNATGAHLHFEIREHETARDPMLYLPR